MILFLVDEGCDAIMVRKLRALSFDVTYVAESAPGKLDSDILSWAHEENRILITEDQDFSKLIFRDDQPAYGVVLIRIPDTERPKKAAQIEVLVSHHLDALIGSAVTVFPNRIKLRPLPKTDQEEA